MGTPFVDLTAMKMEIRYTKLPEQSGKPYSTVGRKIKLVKRYGAFNYIM